MRPTAVNLAWAVKRVKRVAGGEVADSAYSRGERADPEALVEAILSEAIIMIDEDNEGMQGDRGVRCESHT